MKNLLFKEIQAPNKVLLAALFTISLLGLTFIYWTYQTSAQIFPPGDAYTAECTCCAFTPGDDPAARTNKTVGLNLAARADCTTTSYQVARACLPSTPAFVHFDSGGAVVINNNTGNIIASGTCIVVCHETSLTCRTTATGSGSWFAPEGAANRGRTNCRENLGPLRPGEVVNSVCQVSGRLVYDCYRPDLQN